MGSSIVVLVDFRQLLANTEKTTERWIEHSQILGAFYSRSALVFARPSGQPPVTVNRILHSRRRSQSQADSLHTSHTSQICGRRFSLSRLSQTAVSPVGRSSAEVNPTIGRRVATTSERGTILDRLCERVRHRMTTSENVRKMRHVSRLYFLPVILSKIRYGHRGQRRRIRSIPLLASFT